MKHLTLLFSLFVSPALDQFQFTPGESGAGQEPWCHTYGRAQCSGTGDLAPSYKVTGTSQHFSLPTAHNCIAEGSWVYIIFNIQLLKKQ